MILSQISVIHKLIFSPNKSHWSEDNGLVPLRCRGVLESLEWKRNFHTSWRSGSKKVSPRDPYIILWEKENYDTSPNTWSTRSSLTQSKSLLLRANSDYKIIQQGKISVDNLLNVPKNVHFLEFCHLQIFPPSAFTGSANKGSPGAPLLLW